MQTAENRYRAFLNGDKAAFASLVEEYRPGLIRFVNSYVHDVHTAEDIAIDCFAYLLAHPGRYRFTSPLKSYLYTVGRSRAVDWLRRAKRAKTVPLEAAEEEIAFLYLPQDAAEQREKYAALYRAMETLPEDMRRAVTLYYFDELNYKQIAAVLGKSSKQVDNLLYRAKTRLRAILEEGGEAP